MASKLNNRVIGALAVVYFVWSSTYLGIAIVSHNVPPLLGAGTRFVAAGLLLGVILMILRPPAKLKVTWRELAGACGTGIMLLTIGIGAVSLAVQYVPSGAAAVLVATEPLWIISLRAATGQRPGRRTIVGVVLGLVGVALLVWFVGADDPNPGDGYINAGPGTVIIWMIVVLVATLVWSWASFDSPRMAKQGWAPTDPFTSTFYQFLSSGIVLLIIGFLIGENPASLLAVDSAVVAVWALIVIGAVAAFTCFVWLLHNVPVSLVSTYAYVNPAVAVVLGFLVLSEPMNVGVGAAIAFVVAGVALVVSGESHQAVEP